MLALVADRDAWHSAAVAGAACVLSAGLVYIGYFVHVLRVARKAPCVPERGECVLLFGKHAPAGRIDRDFEARLDRAISLWRERPPASVLLLGGGDPGEPSEAALARDGLLARGWATDAPLRLEARSRDTMENLRNARALLGSVPVATVGAGAVITATNSTMAATITTATTTLAMAMQTPTLLAGAPMSGAPMSGNPVAADVAVIGPARLQVTLLSSRYHLARCALFARQLGFDADLCAAEPRLQLGPRMVLRLAGEAAYVCWSDLGTRWARLIGHQRMLGRVT